MRVRVESPNLVQFSKQDFFGEQKQDTTPSGKGVWYRSVYTVENNAAYSFVAHVSAIWFERWVRTFSSVVIPSCMPMFVEKDKSKQRWVLWVKYQN